jgi:1-aminocyclopropane-1-carboxylate deaminase/D-cysteine desulfhydrase-like pyridoxal-dependent ACC family enzyme
MKLCSENMTELPEYRPRFEQIRLASEGGFLVTVDVLREDLAHGYYQGNKWWKLKKNLSQALSLPVPAMLTFGGAYSNHIHATAAAGKSYGIKTVGIIRGERPQKLSPTLKFAAGCGMHLEFVSREEYGKKRNPGFISSLLKHFGPIHIVPEGGANHEGFEGCAEWANHLKDRADIFFISAGTGTTAAGFASALPDAEIWAVSSLKGGEFLKADAEAMAGKALPNLKLLTEYHFGGYAKYTPDLLRFMESAPIPLEQVYTAKTLFALADNLKTGKLPENKRICFIHTGGLQGRLNS